MEEVFHSQGLRFEHLDDIREKIRTLGRRWNKLIAPALINLAEESGYMGSPESTEDSNGIIICMCTIKIMVIERGEMVYAGFCTCVGVLRGYGWCALI